ncbi:MAG: hypothetical protein M3Y75_01630 [Actinomycetota bacterium]|nr:hypothetical protein [Actinomycetota bacterium]
MPTGRAILRLFLGAAMAALLLTPTPASAEETYEASYDRGEVLIAVDDQFTTATIQKLVHTFDGCDTEPDESNCTWEVKGVLSSDPATRCNPSTPESQVVFSSGPQTGNGTYSAPPQSFPLEGCRGQVIVFWERVEKTFEPPPSGIFIGGGSSSFLSFQFGFDPVKEAEEAILHANTAPTLQPPPVPPALSISANCRALTIGSTRYVFAFRQMGCRKAGNLARMRHLSGTAPSGYACSRRSGGIRCWRQGKPSRYVQWTLPR